MLAPTVYPRLVSFAAAIVCVIIYLKYGVFSQESSGVLARMALGEAAWSDFSSQGWRLVSGTFTHTNVMLALCSVFMLWGALGDFEERAGAGAALGLLIVDGAILNLVRIQVESPASLPHLSGAWCVGVAAGVAAAVLARRRGESAKRPLLTLAILGGLWAAFVFFAGAWQNALFVSGAASVAVGAAVGAIWPSGLRTIRDLSSAPRPQRGLRYASGALAALVLVGAFAQERLAETGPPQRIPIPALTQRVVPEPLLVELMLPSSWDEAPLPKHVKCGTCGEQAEWDRALINDPIPDPKRCKKCSDEVLHGNRHYAVYINGGMMLVGTRRQLLVYTQERAAYDDPDTFIEFFLQTQYRGDASEFREAPIEQQEFFSTESYPRGYRLVLRGKKRRATLYSFRTKSRTLLFVFEGPAPDTAISVQWEDDFHQAIMETVKPWKPERKPSPTPSPTPTATPR